jgi:hypothetical protein
MGVFIYVCSCLPSLLIPCTHLFHRANVSGFAGANDPRMCQNFIRIKSLVWVFDKQFSDDVFSLVADRLPHWCVEVEVDILDLFKQHKVIFIEEGWSSAKQDVKYNADAPKITALIVRQLL